MPPESDPPAATVCPSTPSSTCRQRRGALSRVRATSASACPPTFHAGQSRAMRIFGASSGPLTTTCTCPMAGKSPAAVSVFAATRADVSAPACGPMFVKISTSSGPPSHDVAAPLCHAACPATRRGPACTENFSMSARPLSAGPPPAGAVMRADMRTSALAPCPSRAASVPVSVVCSALADSAACSEASSPAVMSSARSAP